MQIEVIASVNEARSDDLAGKTVLVIDVLRASSNMVTALVHGCPCLIPVETVQQAKALQQPGDLLGGERNCKKLAGFDIGNSPFEYMELVRGKRILMTTTNGTRAVQKTQRAFKVLACSLLNATACAEAAAAWGKDVYILCSGTQDVFALEDGLCAGMAAEALHRLTGGQIEGNDLCQAMRSAYLHNQDHLEETLLSSANGRRLARIGFGEDVAFCSRRDLYDLVPVLQNGCMVPADLPASTR